MEGGGGYLPDPEWAFGPLVGLDTPTTMAAEVADRVEREIAELRRCGGPTERGIELARRLRATIPASAPELLARERRDGNLWRVDLAYALAVLAWAPEGAAWDGRTWREGEP